MTGETPDHLIDWKGNDWTPDVRRARPRTRTPASRRPAAQCPSIADEWEDPKGVPIDAFLFGGRRSTGAPLVREAFDWEHGVFLGATMSSEKTAAAAGTVGELRFDPFAMLPFCGYNMADYFEHWLKIGEREGAQLPKIFHVNWFRKDDDGKFLWPGFGENSRVLAWIFRRCDGEAEADETPIGYVPEPEHLELDGLDRDARGRGAERGPRRGARRARPDRRRTWPGSATELPTPIRDAVRGAQGAPELSCIV